MRLVSDVSPQSCFRVAGDGGQARGQARAACRNLARLGRRGWAGGPLAMLGLLVALLPCSAAAQDRVTMPGVGRVDPRIGVDTEVAPWRALVRVQTAVGARCTGVLVAPDHVLTSSECLRNPVTNGRVAPGSVMVFVGYRRGTWVAEARAVSARAGQGMADWAVLRLDRPIASPDRILPLLSDLPAPQTPIMMAGWQRDRPEVLLADTDCRVLGVSGTGDGPMMVLHNCAGTSGVSGAPLLARRADGGWAVIAVQSAAALGGALGQAVAVAATFD